MQAVKYVLNREDVENLNIKSESDFEAFVDAQNNVRRENNLPPLEFEIIDDVDFRPSKAVTNYIKRKRGEQIEPDLTGVPTMIKNFIEMRKNRAKNP